MDDNRVKLLSRVGIFIVIVFILALVLGRSVSFSIGDIFSADIGANDGNDMTEDASGDVKSPTEEPEDDPTEIPTSEPTEAVVVVEIIVPGEGETVARELTLGGTAVNVPDDLAVWVYVYSAGDGVYMLTVAERLDDGSWTAEVLVGAKGNSDSGSSFRVGVVLADDAAVKSILDNYEELPVLPGGVELMDEIVVVRE